MKKIFLLLLTTLFVGSLNAQFGQSRVLEVKEGHMAKFVDGVEKKTQKYNRSEGSAKFYTFQILTGPNATDFVRVRWMESLASFKEKSPESMLLMFSSLAMSSKEPIVKTKSDALSSKLP